MTVLSALETSRRTQCLLLGLGLRTTAVGHAVAGDVVYATTCIACNVAALGTCLGALRWSDGWHRMVHRAALVLVGRIGGEHGVMGMWMAHAG